MSSAPAGNSSASTKSLPNYSTTPGSAHSTTMGNNTVDCGAFVDCGNCTSSLSCVWCPTLNNGTCHAGNWLGVDSKPFGTLNGTCADWHWATCKPAFLQGRYMQYAALGVLGLIVCCCTLCVCKCFCCKRKSKGKKDRKLDKFGEDREPLLADDTPKRDPNSKSAQRRDAMRKKWGLDGDDAV